MILFGVIASTCNLVHMCPGAYYWSLRRKLISFLISLLYFSTFVFVYFGPQAGAGTDMGQERGARQGAVVTVCVLVLLYCMVS